MDEVSGQFEILGCMTRDFVAGRLEFWCLKYFGAVALKIEKEIGFKRILGKCV
jgi:hypothetical protein